MNVIDKIRLMILLCLSILFVVIFSENVLAVTPKIRICLTGSLYKIYPEYGMAFKQGAELAINELNKRSKTYTLELALFYYDIAKAPSKASSLPWISGVIDSTPPWVSP